MSKDLFSRQAAAYAKYRPSYPAALIEYITGFVKEKNMVWDCATGNGQAAVLLAAHFKKVIATDSSEKQIQLAPRKENIEYAIAKAEQTGFADSIFDLITVAQAYHWFVFDAFEKEVKRVAKPGAVIAVWGYNIPQCNNEELNRLIRHFYTEVVGKYWDAERKYVDQYYSTVPFHFEELPSKEFSIQVEWNKNDLPGYLNSWSSVQHFIKANGCNPVDKTAIEIEKKWPPENTALQFRFPVFLRAGRVVK
jgi:ubiquinone/menaquinone biosynthesis C-methylase UbiE